MKTSLIVILFLGLLAFSFAATKQIYRQCPNGKAIDNIQGKVVVSNCTRIPCKLKKKTSVQISIKLKPEEDVKKLTTTVSANIIGVPFPFIGVDGTNACDDIFDSQGKNVGCPLKANQEYVYSKAIDVLELYPNIKTVVHWALTGPKGDVFCFEVPARIVN